MARNTEQFGLFLESLHSVDPVVVGAIMEAYGLLFEATVDEIYAKYYSDIDRSIFDKINASDPTSGGSKRGKYLDWLIRLYKRGNLKLEDLYKVTEYLGIYAKYSAKTAKPDINAIKSLPELYDVIEPIKTKLTTTSGQDALIGRKAQKSLGMEEVDKFYEDDKWLVVIPKTKRASCAWGSGTQWCTAADSDQNMFDKYNDEGPLYIVINKDSGEKYQFHMESGSYMDKSDREIDPRTIGLPADLLTRVVSLNYAVQLHDIEFAKSIISSGQKPINEEDYLLNTLRWAIEGGNPDMVYLIIKAGGKPYNMNDETSSMNDASNVRNPYHRYLIIKTLINAGDSPTLADLEIASRFDDIMLVDKIISTFGTLTFGSTMYALEHTNNLRTAKHILKASTDSDHNRVMQYLMFKYPEHYEELAQYVAEINGSSNA